MNILYVTVADLMGQQFNGYLLHRMVKRIGHNSAMAVLRKQSDEPDIYRLQRERERPFESLMTSIEKACSLYSILPITASGLYHAPYYRKADILHLQLVHAMTSFFSLFNVPIMSRARPTIWTLHDLWLMTGHCVHPFECEGWRSGCGDCNDLETPFAIRRDTTAFTWNVKKWIMHNSKVSLVVASRWMYDRVRQSPILSHLPCRIIPFGVDTAVFKPLNKAELRRRLGIPENAHVLACRACIDYGYKGTAYLKQALSQMRLSKPTYLITLDGKGAVDSLRDKYHLIEMGWMDDQNAIAEVMSAADVFLMPSIAESFGMMALESMACGVPVVCFEETAVPGVIDAPKGGIAVPYKNSAAFAAAVETLLSKDDLRQQLTENCLDLVKNEYSLELYINRHLELYQELLAAKN